MDPDASGTNGSFVISASGADIWDVADEFHFVFQRLDGDGVVIARVNSLPNTDSWAKSGVMVRQNLDANSPHAFMAVTVGNGGAFERRITLGDTTLLTLSAGVTVPYWVKLGRSANLFTGYVSSNGVNWELVGWDTVPMSNPVYAGLAVTAHNNSVFNTSTFTDVQIRTNPLLNLAPYVGTGPVRLFIGGQTGASYLLQTSTNLADWTPLGTVVTTNTTTEFLDTPPPGTPARFYRAFLIP